MNSNSANMLAGARRAVSLAEPAVMGVLNVTPDSFSDGGRYVALEAALERSLVMIEQGAAIIDIGGESTRPGAAPVSTEAELERVLPVVEALRARSEIFISVDTSNPAVIQAVCAAGADMINDIRGLVRPGALEAVVAAEAAACVMHMQGEPATMQTAPSYTDVVAEVRAFLDDRVRACCAAGMAPERIVVDPGFGFGKTLEHNMALLRGVGELGAAGRPVLMGVSRKSMFARLFELDGLGARINGSLGAAFWATLQGVGIIRCHDVRETAQMVCLARHLMQQG
ncbi:MAG: dihydropteroate synthase [Salinisphaera sp.]|uniref:dihydropteroate synthase n=1 Tax=Salinisphaera sp. TaxID=1914330 RepID=UPI003C7B17ED